jgi:hypothetical protein
MSDVDKDGYDRSTEADRIRAQFERGLTRLYPVQYTSEVARTVESGEEVERMKSRAVDADAEREAQTELLGIRARDEMCSIDAGSVGEQACKIDRRKLLRRLDEARAEIATLKRENESLTATEAQAHYDRDCSWRHIAERDVEIARLREANDRLQSSLRDSQNDAVRLRRELDRWRAPSEADAMDLAAGLCRQLELMYLGPEGDEVDPAAQEFLARAITEYGEQRAREVETAAVLRGRQQGKDELALELKYGSFDAVVQKWIREARAEYVEESRRLREACVTAARAEARAAGFEAGEACAVDNALSILDEEGWLGKSKERIRALAAPPQPEGGEG